MKNVTLYSQNRYSPLSTLPEPHLRYVTECLKDALGPDASIDIYGTSVNDLEKILNINFVDKNRDLSQVRPIESQQYFVFQTRQCFQPLLDALEKGDFELAEALTPNKYRLCGYNELKENTQMDQYGMGWAGQFDRTIVPAGIYPIFVSSFAYHERDKHFTNEVRGVTEWFEGQCIESSDIYFKGAEPNVVLKNPYAYDVASSASKNVGTRHLVYPFQTVSTVHEHGVGDSTFIYFSIVDSTVPYKADKNPLSLRCKCVPAEPEKKSLASQIRQAEAKKRPQSQDLQVKSHTNDKPSPQR